MDDFNKEQEEIMEMFIKQIKNELIGLDVVITSKEGSELEEKVTEVLFSINSSEVILRVGSNPEIIDQCVVLTFEEVADLIDSNSNHKTH